jgi:hypothetical protein
MNKIIITPEAITELIYEYNIELCDESYTHHELDLEQGKIHYLLTANKKIKKEIDNEDGIKDILIKALVNLFGDFNSNFLQMLYYVDISDKYYYHKKNKRNLLHIEIPCKGSGEDLIVQTCYSSYNSKQLQKILRTLK